MAKTLRRIKKRKIMAPGLSYEAALIDLQNSIDYFFEQECIIL